MALRNRIARKLFSDRIFNLARILYKGQQDFHFLHVTKAGGKLFKSIVKQETSRDYPSVMCHDHVIRRPDLPKSSRVVVGIRDPFARFVSGYYSPLRNVRGDVRSLSKPLQKFYSIYPAIDDAIVALANEESQPSYLHLNPHLGIYRSLKYWLGENESMTGVYFYETETLARKYGSKKYDQRTLTGPKDFEIDNNLAKTLTASLSSEYAFYEKLKENCINILPEMTGNDLLENIKNVQHESYVD